MQNYFWCNRKLLYSYFIVLNCFNSLVNVIRKCFAGRDFVAAVHSQLASVILTDHCNFPSSLHSSSSLFTRRGIVLPRFVETIKRPVLPKRQNLVYKHSVINPFQNINVCQLVNNKITNIVIL